MRTHSGGTSDNQSQTDNQSDEKSGNQLQMRDHSGEISDSQYQMKNHFGEIIDFATVLLIQAVLNCTRYNLCYPHLLHRYHC